MSKRTSIGIAVWVALLAPGESGVSAQQTAVCSDTPGEGERIECTQDSTSTTDIGIYPEGCHRRARSDESVRTASALVRFIPALPKEKSYERARRV